VVLFILERQWGCMTRGGINQTVDEILKITAGKTSCLFDGRLYSYSTKFREGNCPKTISLGVFKRQRGSDDWGFVFDPETRARPGSQYRALALSAQEET
jgi:hypothetical protein